MAPHHVEGWCSLVSHLLLLTGNKCFLVKVDKVVVVVSLEKSPPIVQQWHTGDRIGTHLLGKKVKISHLARLPDYRGVVTYKTTSRSEIVSNLPSSSSDQEMPKISVMEGEITDDLGWASGLYTLDDSMQLVTAALCHMTNVRRFRKGQLVRIYNGHVTRKRVVLCARSLALVQGENFDSAFPSEKERQAYLRCSLLDLFHTHNLSLWQYLFLQRLQKQWPDQESHDWRNIVRELQQARLFETLKEDSRKLMREFFDDAAASHPHSCPFTRPRERGLSLYHVRIEDLLRKHSPRLDQAISERTALYNDTGSRAIEFDCAKIPLDNAVLFGKIELSEATGHLHVLAEPGSLRSLPICLVEEGSRTAGLHNQLVCIEDFELVAEWLCHKDVDWKLVYVRASMANVRVLTGSSQAAGEPDASRGLLTVTSCSESVLGSRDTDKPCVVFSVQDDCTRKTCFARAPIRCIGSRALALPPGSKVQFHPNETASHFLPMLYKLGRYNFETKCSYDLRRPLAHVQLAEPGDAVLSKKETFSLDDLSLIPPNELVTIEAVIAERWLESHEHKTRKYAIRRQNVDTLTPDLNLQLKLRSASEVTGLQASCYITDWSNRAYPLGILPDTRVRIENVEKRCSQKGYVYFETTLLTRFQVLETYHSAAPALPVTCSLLRDIIIPDEADKNMKTYLSRLILVSVDKVNILAKCVACGSPVSSGYCSYPGCHANMNESHLECDARFTVTDCSGLHAQLFVKSQWVLQTLLALSSDAWSTVKSAVHQLGEMSFVSTKHTDNVKICQRLRALSTHERDFYIYCDVYLEYGLHEFKCLCRPFRRQQDEQGFADIKVFALEAEAT